MLTTDGTGEAAVRAPAAWGTAGRARQPGRFLGSGHTPLGWCPAQCRRQLDKLLGPHAAWAWLTFRTGLSPAAGAARALSGAGLSPWHPSFPRLRQSKLSPDMLAIPWGLQHPRLTTAALIFDSEASPSVAELRGHGACPGSRFPLWRGRPAGYEHGPASGALSGGPEGQVGRGRAYLSSTGSRRQARGSARLSPSQSPW